MLKRILLMAFILFQISLHSVQIPFFFPKNYKYKLAVCAMFKNEAPWLKEWIEFHKIIGVEHFYLYNNDSTDNYLEVLDPYINDGLVELIDWPSIAENWDDNSHLVRGTSWWGYQFKAYNACLKNVLGKVQWLAILDIDEFIVPIDGKESLQLLLDDATKLNIGSLWFSWRCFGTSNVWEISDGALITEIFFMRSEDEHPWNQIPKSIHRPEAIKYVRIHDAEELMPGYIQFRVPPEFCRINHYWAKNAKWCIEKRWKYFLESYEQLKEVAPPADYQNIHTILSNLNLVEDRIIEQYLPELKKAMNISK